MESLSEQSLKEQLEELQRQLGKKQRFEEAVFSVNSLLKAHYSSASPSLQKTFYTVICRVATILKTRYTAPGFWLAGLQLFELAESLSSDQSKKAHLKNCISQAKEHLQQVDELTPIPESTAQTRGYLFEGHLTVDPEPPQPQWLVQQNFLAAAASALIAESSRGAPDNATISESAATVIEALITHLDNTIPMVFDNENDVPKVPPASKVVVANLPVIGITEEVLEKLGKHAECVICKENLVVGDKMQELPCKHTFHPPCSKPWLDEHNSCPICRHELPTDVPEYERWKEREREAEEERKGAANAVRGGEYMYV